MRVLVWALRAAIFFVLFAFALNNQHESTVRWFFGLEWRAPMVFIVLAAFAAGSALGVLAMVPSWWRQRRPGRTESAASSSGSASTVPAPAPPPTDLEPAMPPRDGL